MPGRRLTPPVPTAPTSTSPRRRIRPMRTVVLVDGEHYPPVTRWGIEIAGASAGTTSSARAARRRDREARPRRLPDLGVPIRPPGIDRMAALAEAIDELAPDVVLDLSDEPVLGYRERMELAAVALARGVPYAGADFGLDPPVEGPPLGVADAGRDRHRQADGQDGDRRARRAAGGRAGSRSDGRGDGPRGSRRSPRSPRPGACTSTGSVELVRAGEHAASDYLEDALTTGVTTIGARRAGGGLAGAPFATNVREAAELAAARGPGVVVLEGSGAAVPPVPWDAGVLVVPAGVAARVPRRLSRPVPAVAVGPGGCYHGEPARSPGPRTLSALRSHVLRVPRRCRSRRDRLHPGSAGRCRGSAGVLRHHRPRRRRRPAGRAPARGHTDQGGGVERTAGRPGRPRGGPGRGRRRTTCSSPS